MTKTCTDKALFESLIHCDGKTLIPGNRKAIYYIPKSKVKTFPKIADTPEADIKGIMSYEGDFVLESDAKWLRIDQAFNKGRYTHETQGPGAGSNTILNKYETMYADTDEVAAGVAMQLINTDCLVAFQRHDGRFRILGNESFETKVTTSSDSGEAPTDESGLKLTFECTDIRLCPFYPGKIETEAGDISGADGSVLPGALP